MTSPGALHIKKLASEDGEKSAQSAKLEANKVFQSRGSDQLCQMLLTDQEDLRTWAERLED